MRKIVDDVDIITEPVGRAGIRYIGFKNPPPPVVERTMINRSEAYLMLDGHELILDIPKELKEAVRNGIPWTKTMADDPTLRISPKIEFNYMTEADIDPRTGMPRIMKRKGKAPKIVRSRITKFTLGAPSLFTITSKMSASSFSIPAGPPSPGQGGTCAAAELFNSPRTYQVALQQGDIEQRSVDKKTWICSYCYAGKSNYMHRTAQYSQTARWIWMKGMLTHHGVEASAEILTDALQAHLFNQKKREKVGENPNYFRIHDSGDLMLKPSNYELWCLVARALHWVHFWCPTRMWVFPKFSELVRRIPPPKNLTLRPSALHFDDQAPRVMGYHAGSTAHTWDKTKKVDPVKEGIADWNCPAYQHDGHSCAGAGGPEGAKDCRVCWDRPELRVSYRSH